MNVIIKKLSLQTPLLVDIFSGPIFFLSFVYLLFPITCVLIFSCPLWGNFLLSTLGKFSPVKCGEIFSCGVKTYYFKTLRDYGHWFKKKNTKDAISRQTISLPRKKKKKKKKKIKKYKKKKKKKKSGKNGVILTKILLRPLNFIPLTSARGIYLNIIICICISICICTEL